MQIDSRESNVSSGFEWNKILRVGMLCSVYILASASIIRFNKFLMHEDRFPYSLPLTALHMAGSTTMCSLLYLVWPAAFPGVAASAGKRGDIAKWFLLIGGFFACSLFTSNQAYLYAKVTFLQFMKEGNVVLGFLISCIMGVQVFNRVRASVIVFIMASALLCVSAEVDFVWIGFAFQLTSQLAESTRVVLSEFVLGGRDLKLDPLSFTLFVAPVSLAVLLPMNVYAWEPEIWSRALAWWPYLLPNVALAFVLNLLVANVIKETSAVGCILTGLVKDVSLVSVSALFFGEVVTGQQVVGFVLVLIGVAVWSLLKMNPDHEVVLRVERAMGLQREEKAALLSKHANV